MFCFAVTLEKHIMADFLLKTENPENLNLNNAKKQELVKKTKAWQHSNIAMKSNYEYLDGCDRQQSAAQRSCN